MRMNTKERREQYRAAQFNSLISSGWSREDYKGLVIFTKNEGGKYMIKAYQGTAAEPFYYKYHTTEAGQLQKVQEMKEGHDRQAAWKEKQKAERKPSRQAAAAAAIREELKKNFPGIKFSVTSDSFAGGDSVDVRYTDGPTTDEVEAIIGKYQYGHFNGMEDLYEYSNSRDDIPQSKYVHASRSMSKEAEALQDVLKEKFPGYFEQSPNDYDHHSARSVFRRLFYKSSFPAGAVFTGIEKSGDDGGFMEDWFKITFTAPEQAPAANIAPVETLPGTVNIIDYSEKAIAVVGDTRPIKDQLKAAGGKFNFRLSCGPGWIFSKSRLQAVTNLLKEIQPQQDGERTEEQEEALQEVEEAAADLLTEAEGFGALAE